MEPSHEYWLAVRLVAVLMPMMAAKERLFLSYQITRSAGF
jgi:hypothetical protein